MDWIAALLSVFVFVGGHNRSRVLDHAGRGCNQSRYDGLAVAQRVRARTLASAEDTDLRGFVRGGSMAGIECERVLREHRQLNVHVRSGQQIAQQDFKT